MARAPNTKSRRKRVDYVKQVGELDWAGLTQLWQKIQERKTTGWEPGKALEHLVLRGFELSGAKVIWPYPVYVNNQLVEQIDGMVIFDGVTCMVEVKDYDGNVNIEPLTKLRNQLLRRPAGLIGGVFSSAGFTDPAKTLAQYMAPHAILLWQGPEIAGLLKKQDFTTALKKKLQYLMQHGNPDYDTRAEDVQ